MKIHDLKNDKPLAKNIVKNTQYLFNKYGGNSLKEKNVNL